MSAPLATQRISPSGEPIDIRELETPDSNVSASGVIEVTIPFAAAEIGQTYLLAGPKEAMPAALSSAAVSVPSNGNLKVALYGSGATAATGVLHWDAIRVR